MQYHRDIHALNQFDGMIWVCESLDDTLIQLINNAEVREQFVEYDVSELRASELHANAHDIISIDHLDHAVIEHAIEERSFHCTMQTKSKVPCLSVFNSARALALHISKSKNHAHEHVRLHAFVLTNQCPWCESVFASNMSAFNHARHAIERDGCVVDKAFLPKKLITPTSIVCPMCEKQFDSLHNYYEHIRLHIVFPESVTLSTQAAPATMDLFSGIAGAAAAIGDASDSASPGNAKKSKAAHRSPKDQEKFEDFLTILAKQVLSINLQTRVHRAIVLDCFRVKTDSTWYTAHKEATTKYATIAKKLREDGKSSQEIKEMLGLPSIHGFNALLTTYLQLKLDPEKIKQMTEVTALWKSQEGWKTIHQHVRHCRMA